MMGVVSFFVGLCGCSLQGFICVRPCLASHCCVTSVLSGTVITLLGKRELFALLLIGLYVVWYAF